MALSFRRTNTEYNMYKESTNIKKEKTPRVPDLKYQGIRSNTPWSCFVFRLFLYIFKMVNLFLKNKSGIRTMKQMMICCLLYWWC